MFCRMTKVLCTAIAAITLSSHLMAASKPIPLILDTDIGTDVDDAYALVLAARSPRLDLRAVTTAYGNVALRSTIARKLLGMMGKSQVPVASGLEKALDGHEIKMGGWEGKGLLAEAEEVKGVSPTPAPDLIIQILSGSNQKVTIASVGGLSNVAMALKMKPEVKMNLERIVIMGGCVRPFILQGKRIPDHLETNLHHDVDAATLVLQRPSASEFAWKLNLAKSALSKIQKVLSK